MSSLLSPVLSCCMWMLQIHCVSSGDCVLLFWQDHAFQDTSWFNKGSNDWNKFCKCNKHLEDGSSETSLYFIILFRRFLHEKKQTYFLNLSQTSCYRWHLTLVSTVWRCVMSSYTSFIVLGNHTVCLMVCKTEGCLVTFRPVCLFHERKDWERMMHRSISHISCASQVF